MNKNLKNAYYALWWEMITILFLSLFSGPLKEMGITSLLPFNLEPARRVGRIIFVYHSVAVPFVCALLFLALYILKIEGKEISHLAIPGYILTTIGGLGFSYFSDEWFLHGLFVFGLSLSFFAGVIFFIEIFKLYRKKTSIENLLYLHAVLFTLITTAIGGVIGSYFGKGFNGFLAEDVLRASHDIFQRAVISHLHLMLALIDFFVLLLVITHYNVPEKIKRNIFPSLIVGIIIMSVGTWAVMPFEEIAHKIINIGAIFLLVPAGIVSFWGFKNYFRDSPSFGIFFYLIAVNLYVTFPGIYIAINLEKIRKLPYSVERVFTVGHWHVLATLTAIIGFLLLVEIISKGLQRQIIGWLAVFGSFLAFSSALIYFTSNYTGKLITYSVEAGIFLVLFSIGIFLIGERKAII